MENKEVKIEDKKALVIIFEDFNSTYHYRVISYPSTVGFPWSLAEYKINKSLTFSGSIVNVIFDFYQKERVDIIITEEEINKFYCN